MNQASAHRDQYHGRRKTAASISLLWFRVGTTDYPQVLCTVWCPHLLILTRRQHRKALTEAESEVSSMILLSVL